MAETGVRTPDDSVSGGGRSSQESQDDVVVDAPTTKAPLLSILNVVVDHAKGGPSPMEPMEFREACL